MKIEKMKEFARNKGQCWTKPKQVIKNIQLLQLHKVYNPIIYY